MSKTQVFEFFTEDGAFKMEYADYCKAPELIDTIADDNRILVNLGLKILSFDRRWLEDHPHQRRYVENMEHEREQNPIRFFLPHCAGYPDFNTPSHKFINDAEHIYAAIVAGNRFGKTTLMWVTLCVRFGLIPCDPNWEIFTEHGVEYGEWLGPREAGMVSYQWDSHRKTIWPQVMRAWTPQKEILDYLGWEVPQKTTGEVLPFDCGTRTQLMACSQPQAAFESQALDVIGWDEQGVGAKFDGANARLKTRRKFSRNEEGFEYLTRGVHRGGLTPHKLKDRPDTGGGTWLHRLAEGTEKRGMTVKFYQGNLLKDVPDWVYSERQKKLDLEELEEAKAKNNRKRVRSIESRLFGKWEHTGGLVYDMFDRDLHVINDFEIPSSWCAFRCLDHGRTNPTACLWIAITPSNDWVVYREYEGAGNTISENCKQIIERSGNTRERVNNARSLYPVYKEDQCSEIYLFDVLDGRTFKRPDENSTDTLGQLYQKAGLNRCRAAVIDTSPGCATGIHKVSEMLSIREEERHIQTGEKGASRLYFMRSCTGVIGHMMEYRNKERVNDEGNPMEKPQEKDDHDMDALRYGATSPARYIPTRTIRIPEKEAANGTTTRGYWVPEDGPQRDSASRAPRRSRDKFTGL